MDRKALIGLLSGVLMVVVTLIGVGLLNTRQAEGAAKIVSRSAPHDCGTGLKSAELGYGVASPNEACVRAY